MDEKYNDWLNSLNIGYKVAVEESSYGHRKIVFTEIVRITPNRAMRVKWNAEYLFKDGMAGSGGKWASTYYKIKEITDELIKSEQKRREIEQIMSFKEWNELNSDEIKKIVNIIANRKRRNTYNYISV